MPDFVPRAVAAIAAETLELQQQEPMDGVYGVSLAERLVAGTATVDDAKAMHRFFTVNERNHRVNEAALRSPETNADERSWYLHGGEAGRTWAARVARENADENAYDPTPVDSLFGKQPDEIYDLFSLGAWRHEYGMDVRKAARFAEDYQRATGFIIELDRAFGDSAGAVGQAMYRRAIPKDPYTSIMECLAVDDPDYQFAAQVDLAELNESLFPQAGKMSDAKAAKELWGPFVAYFILAVEAPEMLKEMNAESKKPPKFAQKPAAPSNYHDAINTAIVYFHPQGSKYVTTDGSKFAGLDEEILDAIDRAYMGKVLKTKQVQKMLGSARRWTAQNKLAGSQFHVFNADWKKANWQHILDNIPQDADVRPAFEQFASGNPMPKDGMKLQQTLVNKDAKTEILDYLTAALGVPQQSLKPVKVNDTDAGKAAAGASTPFGIWSVFSLSGDDRAYVGAWQAGSKVYHVLTNRDDLEGKEAVEDDVLTDAIKDGSAQVKFAHKDMPGSNYSGTGNQDAPAAQQPDSLSDSSEQDGAAVAELLNEYYGKTKYIQWVGFEEAKQSHARWTAKKYADLKMGQRLEVYPYKTGTKAVATYLGTVTFELDTAFSKPVTMVVLKGDAHADALTDGSEVGQGGYHVYTDLVISDMILAEELKPMEGNTEQTLDGAKKDSEEQSARAHAVETLNTFHGGKAGYSWVPFDQAAASYTAWLDAGWTQPYNGMNLAFMDPFGNLGKGVFLGVLKGTNNTTQQTEYYVAVQRTEGDEALDEGVYTRKGDTFIYRDDVFGERIEAETIEPDVAEQNDFQTMKAGQSIASSAMKYAQGQILEYKDTRWVVVSPVSGIELYVITKLQPAGTGDGNLTMTVAKDELEADATRVRSADWTITSIGQYVDLKGGEFVESGEDFVGMTWGDGNTVIGRVSNPTWMSGDRMLIGNWFATVPAGMEEGFEVPDYAYVLLSTVEEALNVSLNEYDPPEETPESSQADDIADPEQGNPEMSGTQQAFDFLEKKGWKPTVKSAHSEFLWDLGDNLSYAKGKKKDVRLIIGYGENANGQPLYVIRTILGNVNWVSMNANKKYGPKLGVDQITVDKLLPMPGAAAEVKYPKVNYYLSKRAKEVAQEKDYIYQPAPETAPYKVGTRVLTADGVVAKVLGWIDVSEAPVAVLDMEVPGKGLTAGTASMMALEAMEISYATGLKLDDEADEYDLSKQPKAATVNLSHGEFLMPGDPPDGWDDPEAIEEPPLEQLPKGKHASAGVMVVFPSGTNMSTPAANFATIQDTLMLYKPMGQFGGYKLAIPKGTVDKGESLMKAAVREVYEETGVAVKIVAHLGDYKGDTSITRMYVGYPIGGNPQKKNGKSEECDCVVLRSLLINLQNPMPKWTKDMIPSSGNKWQMKALGDLLAWIAVDGSPHLHAPTTAAAPMPPITQTNAGVAPTAQVDPSMKNVIDGDTSVNLASSAIDYEIDEPFLKAYGEGAFASSEYWQFIKQTPMIGLGYPPVGTSFKIEGVGLKGVEQEALAYVDQVVKSADTQVSAAATVLITRTVNGALLKHILSMTKDGVTLQTLMKPGQFKPVASQVAKTSKTVTAKDDTDVWKSLLFGAVFPMSGKMLTALQAFTKDVGVKAITGFDTAKNSEVGPNYGDFYTTPQGMQYTAIGYVTVKGDGLPLQVLLGMTPSHNVQVMPAGDDKLKTYEVDADQSLAEHGTEPWFVHPDSKTVGIMQKIYTANGDLKSLGLTMGDFKKWLKESKFPSWAVATAPLVQDIAALFIPGLATEAQRDIVIDCMKAKMKSTHKKKAKKEPKAAQPAATITPTSAAPSAALAAAPQISHSFSSPVLKSYAMNPQPSLFEETGHGLPGGSKPNIVLDGPGGQWLFKFNSKKEEFRADVDHAAFLVMSAVKKNVVPVGKMEFAGKLGSYQPVVEDVEPVPSDPSNLNEAQMGELLAQHAYDMFAGDHDGHAGNWLMSNGNLIAIDRGQSFKFLLQGKPEKLDPKWHAPGNHGAGYAKNLLIQWASSDAKTAADIPDSAFAAMAKVIVKIQGLSDTFLESALTPVFDRLKTPATKRKAMLKKLYARRDAYADDWTNTLTKLRKDFKWPVSLKKPTKTTKQLVLKSSPAEQGIQAEHELAIAEAAEAGWQGKSLRVDTWAVENQEVMVRAVQMVQNGVNVPATLLQWRVTHDAGLQAATNMAKKSKVVASSANDVGGPQQLQVDLNNGYWDKIYVAVKSINHHLNGSPDGKPNQGTVGAALALKPDLEALVKATANFSAKTAGDPNEAVNAMAQLYLQYLQIVEVWNADAPNLINQHTPTFDKFLYEEPEEERRERAVSEKPAYDVSLKKGGATTPNVNYQAGKLTVTDFNKPVYNSSNQPRFVITDKAANLRIQFMPPPNLKLSTTGGAMSLGKGVAGYYGICWCVVPGEPSAAVAAHAFKVFEDASGIGMKMATQEDKEVRYWATQAAALQKGGKPKPNSNGEIATAPQLTNALATYRGGDAAAATKELQKYVAKQLGVPVKDAVAAAAGQVDGEFTRGAGHNRVMRLGWDRDKLVKTMGKNAYLAHSLWGGGVHGFLQKAGWNLALLANNQKPYAGVPEGGGSPKADANVGGTQGIFACWRKVANPSNAQAGTLYFDVSIGLRMDVYIVGTGDTFGNQYAHSRAMTPEHWAKPAQQTGGVGLSSSNQVNVRHDIDLQTYLQFAKCASKSEADKCIALAKKNGWKFFGGKAPEEVFVY